MDEELLSKLKKLLTLAQNATSAEAENALEKATAIAAKHNIDLALISIAAPIKEEMIEEKYIQGKRKCVTQRYISWIIQAHFNVDLIYSGSRYLGKSIVFIGRKSD